MVTLQLFKGSFRSPSHILFPSRPLEVTPLICSNPEAVWLALVAGNSRLHWGLFQGEQWLGSWHTDHLSPPQLQALVAAEFTTAAWLALDIYLPLPVRDSGMLETPCLPLWMGAVVQSVASALTGYPYTHRVGLDQIPLGGLYPTLGVDRALTLAGAGDTYGWPVLVIDGGTALTLTAGEGGNLVGGAILPGLRLQFKALHNFTDQLPLVQLEGLGLPQRWAIATPDAIASGVIYTQLAGIGDFVADWRRQYPDGRVVLTGGDGGAIAAYLTQLKSPLAQTVIVDDNLMFWGLRVCWRRGL
jgi:type III pantothenate kinase